MTGLRDALLQISMSLPQKLLRRISTIAISNWLPEWTSILPLRRDVPQVHPSRELLKVNCLRGIR